jgi:serine-type D-Ala-D-Ala carboxypeptidase/endopeptidase (penicillin-binding protein 4)
VYRLRRLTLAALALLCVFVIAAALVVVRLLPPRMARWDLPSVAGRPLATASPPLAAAGGSRTRGSGPSSTVAGAGVTAAGLRAALAPLLRPAALGPRVGLLVTSLGSGQVLLAKSAKTGFTPASTTKLATAVAALHVLGPDARFRTRVVLSARPDGRAPAQIVLVGGGDPTLAAGHPPAGDYPQPATLAALARKTAGALRARGLRRVQVGYDTSLFTGPGMGPGWPLSYVRTGNVTPISALEVDQGRLTISGQPQDADDPANSRPRTMTPAPEAARAFAGFLADDGIAVRGLPAQALAPAGAATLGRVASPPLAQIVQQMLLESNNVIAENLARQVAVATGAPASFAGAAGAETRVLRGLGVTGVHLFDGSGLSPRDRIAPAALVALISLASSAAQPALRPAITGLPVAGFSGTLAPGGSVFAEAGPAALGLVRAKTGNLDTVAALAGLAYARNGQLLAFAVMADDLSATGLDRAGAQLARIATALAGCGCQGAG